MQVRITRVRDHVTLPTYVTDGSVAFDLAAAENMTVPAKELILMPTGLVIATPPGHALLLVARSSLFKKKGLRLANQVGVIDQDFCGPEDEVHLMLWNPGASPIAVERGERLVQGLFVPIPRIEWIEGDTEATNRGGIGSSGGYR